MAKRIYVGNLPYQAAEAELRQLFEQFGQVSSATIIMDRQTGKSKGFAFIEMDVETEADEAIQKLNGSEYGGRKIVVNEARPRTDRGDRSERRAPRQE